MTMTTTDVWCTLAAVFFIIVDYVTGITKAIILVLVAWFIDEINLHVDLGLPVSVFVCTVVGICLIELTSILENITVINPELAGAPFMQIFSQSTSGKHKEE